MVFWNPDKLYVLKKGLLSADKSDESLEGTVTVEYERYLHHDNGKGGEKTSDELAGVCLYFLNMFMALKKRQQILFWA